MTNNRIVTLLTDFGLSDVYVGVMKGVIAQINPQLVVVDLTHQIPPQNIAAGRFCLMSAASYFPHGTVHVAVVDPGVGSYRRAIAVECAVGFFVGPDNGLFSGILRQSPGIAAVELTHSNYWRTIKPSTTFHGRDIFAPVAAHLASGVSLEQLGQVIDLSTLVHLPIPECRQTDAGVAGCIQHVDRFGNLITNIPGTLIQGQIWSVAVAGITILSNITYQDSPFGSPVALVGSHGWVEIAINGGNAQSQLKIECGGVVQILLNPLSDAIGTKPLGL